MSENFKKRLLEYDYSAFEKTFRKCSEFRIAQHHVHFRKVYFGYIFYVKFGLGQASTVSKQSTGLSRDKAMKIARKINGEIKPQIYEYYTNHLQLSEHKEGKRKEIQHQPSKIRDDLYIVVELPKMEPETMDAMYRVINYNLAKLCLVQSSRTDNPWAPGMPLLGPVEYSTERVRPSEFSAETVQNDIDKKFLISFSNTSDTTDLLGHLDRATKNYFKLKNESD